jgi:hypothetical protein
LSQPARVWSLVLHLIQVGVPPPVTFKKKTIGRRLAEDGQETGPAGAPGAVDKDPSSGPRRPRTAATGSNRTSVVRFFCIYGTPTLLLMPRLMYKKTPSVAKPWSTRMGQNVKCATASLKEIQLEYIYSTFQKRKCKLDSLHSIVPWCIIIGGKDGRHTELSRRVDRIYHYPNKRWEYGNATINK